MKIQWEYDLVEKPFCEQLQAMGWQWLEGDIDVPELTERGSFREVLLREPLAKRADGGSHGAQNWHCGITYRGAMARGSWCSAWTRRVRCGSPYSILIVH